MKIKQTHLTWSAEHHTGKCPSCRCMTVLVTAPGKHAEQYQEVKAACGLKSWPNDVARHTFASNL